MERDKVTAVDCNGNERTAALQQITPRRSRKDASALDADQVRVVGLLLLIWPCFVC